MAAGLVFAAGCQGEISDLTSRGAEGSTSLHEHGDPAGTRSAESAGYDDEDAGGLQDAPAPMTRLARLTHTQWTNTVRDLLHLDADTPLPRDFRPDPAQQGFLFDNDSASMEVDGALWSAYQRAAGAVSELVTTDAGRLAQVLPSGSDPGESARAFIAETGARAHRRPLTETEIEEYLELYNAAPTVYPRMGELEGGIRLVLEAFLQSPYFLYRIETSTEQVGNVIPLDGYEVASRLSYMLWNTMPDESLFAAAAAGELTRASSVASHAERMLEDPRAQEVIAQFHEQLLEVERYTIIGPSPAFFPEVSESLALYAVEETDLFIREMVFNRNLGYADLLTSTETFANAELARIYGLSGSFSEELVPVQLDPAERRGFLTHVGWLASHSTSVNPDPIHRGVFVAKRILCAGIGVPPGEIPPLPPPEGRTNRETVADHTEKPGSVCASCHTGIINPLGFPFEHYDAVGGYRTTDNGYPVDASSSPVIGGEQTPVNDAIDLAETLAASPDVHACYAKHWLEFAYGRARADEDRSLIRRLGGLSAERELSVKELIVGLVKTEAFLTRSVEELP